MCLCLFHRRANSQALAPIRPLVVTLDSGSTIRRPLIGLVPAAYQSIRLGRELDRQLLSGRAAEIAALRGVIIHDSLMAMSTAREVLQLRLDLSALNGELTKQQFRTRAALALPTARPLLLDPHTYKGALFGVVLLTVLRLLTMH